MSKRDEQVATVEKPTQEISPNAAPPCVPSRCAHSSLATTWQACDAPLGFYKLCVKARYATLGTPAVSHGSTMSAAAAPFGCTSPKITYFYVWNTPRELFASCRALCTSISP